MRHQLTHYDTLGIERDASEDQIRAAFRRLALKHHPDRFSGADRDQAEERFQGITEAFNILSRAESKAKYDVELGQGGENKTMDRTEIARRLAGKGAQAIREGDIPTALEHLRMAVDHDEASSRANYFLGLALGRVAGRERDALRHMDRAAQLEPHNAAILAEAAILSLAAGMKSRAQRFAEDALALDSESTKAGAVLDQLRQEEKTQGEGLLGRLRRKG